VAHRPWSSKKSFQTRSDIQQEMLGWRRGQPSRLLPFIKSPEAQGIFRLRQSTKASDFFSRQDPSCSERAKHGSCRELGEVIGPYRGTRAPAINQIDQPLQARVATWAMKCHSLIFARLTHRMPCARKARLGRIMKR
jgi:hypothetical protein